MQNSDFIEQVKQSFQYLIDEYDFSIVEEQFSSKFFGNALIRYRSESIDITITLDRNQVLIGLSPVFDMSRRTYTLSALVNYLTSGKPETAYVSPNKGDEHSNQVILQVNQVSRILQEYCSSILMGQFTGWEHIGTK